MNKIVLLFVLITITIFGQISVSNVCLSAGISEFSGLTNSQTGYLIIPSVQISLGTMHPLNYSISYIYTRNLDILIPENRFGKYYGYIHGPALSAVLLQKLSTVLFIQESFGLLLLNDRTLSDDSSVSPGLNFNFSGGINLNRTGITKASFVISLGFHAGITLLNTIPGYRAYTLEFGINL